VLAQRKKKLKGEQIMKTSKKMLSLLLIAAMLVSVLCMGVSASDYAEVSISEGEPVTISWSGTTGTVVSVDGSSYIPRQFILWVRNGFTVSVDGTALTPNSAPSADDTDVAYTINTNATNAITIVASNGTTTYTITCPHYTATASGTNPVAVNGYLPVGQFARPNSFGWGALYTDNTNVSSSSNDVKFKTGYVSTGVSLGMAGGYVQFDMGNNRIQNNANNKYGIDFIVYGNAFKGNPEAAGVQVSNDGVNWYTLAGSRHYMSDTKWNQNISYIKIATANTTIGGKSFAKAGIYVSTDFAAPSSDNASDVDAAVALATWTGIPQLTGSTYPKTYTTDTPAAAAWWPEYASNENYGNVWNIGNAVNGVSWLRNGTAEVITYTGVTTVEDDMVVLNEGATAAPTQAEMTDVYQWGYADVRVNGSQYGTVVNNPYAAAPSTDAGAGGDGFDLSWAVKADGTPIALSSVRYVRVYSAVLFSAGVFGETSAEVCGLYVANAESSSVGTTAAPAITLADGPIPLDMATSMGNNVFYIPAETFEGAFTSGVVVTATASSSTAKVFINGESTGTFTIQDASRGVQILVQDGNSAPFILVIK
jgi:hypothetical protein